MLRLASDEDVHGGIVRELRRRAPDLDIVRVEDAGRDNTPDPDILEWAASESRVLTTGDLNTMVGFAWARVRAGQPMPGVLPLRDNAPTGLVMDDLLLIAKCQTSEQMADEAVIFISL